MSTKIAIDLNRRQFITVVTGLLAVRDNASTVSAIGEPTKQEAQEILVEILEQYREHINYEADLAEDGVDAVDATLSTQSVKIIQMALGALAGLVDRGALNHKVLEIAGIDELNTPMLRTLAKTLDGLETVRVPAGALENGVF